jgi:hypothetical protein
VRFVRDPEAATGIDQLELDPGREGEPPRGTDGRRDVVEQGARIEHIRCPEGVEPDEPQMRRTTRRLGRLDEIGGVHAELAGAIVTDQPNAFQASVFRYRRAEHDRLDAASVRGDGVEAGQLPWRFDGDGPDPEFDRCAQLVIPLAGTGHDDVVGCDAGPANEVQLAP